MVVLDLNDAPAAGAKCPFGKGFSQLPPLPQGRQGGPRVPPGAPPPPRDGRSSSEPPPRPLLSPPLTMQAPGATDAPFMLENDWVCAQWLGLGSGSG